MAVEREIKLAAPPHFALPDLAEAIPDAVVTTSPSRRLRATYWDTPDLRLARSGVSLRYRVEEGEDSSGGRWTLKIAGDSRSSVLSRRELDFQGSPGSVPSEVARLVRAYVRSSTLARVARLDSQRTRLEVRDGEGCRLAEIDDDVVSVMDGRRVLARFREVEVELAPDAPLWIAEELARRLREAGADDPAPLPKVVRALGPQAQAPPDSHLEQPGEGARAGEMVRAALASGLTRLVTHDPGVRLDEDPEEVHQARVATRRLRSDLRTFRSLVDPEWAESLRRELGWLADPLGEVRDADVLLARLRAETGRLPAEDRRAVDTLVERLTTSRAKSLGRLFEALDSTRYVSLLDALVDGVAKPRLAPDAEQPAEDVAPAVVGKAWRKLRKAVSGLGPEPPDAELHRIRIKAKRCRYAAEAVVGVEGKPAKRFANAVAGLQDVLGRLQDAVVATAWLRDRITDETAVGQAVAIGELLGFAAVAAEESRRQWPEAWSGARRKSLRSWLT
ncbi:MAG: CHAD domain-containing protein [Actinobacteria bacterium]|nr:MAG: CHAD domain-containing protein [Actinomycetota bacterium]